MKEISVFIIIIFISYGCGKDTPIEAAPEDMTSVSSMRTPLLKEVRRDNVGIRYYEYYPDSILKYMYFNSESGDYAWRYGHTYSDSGTLVSLYNQLENELVGYRKYYWMEDSIAMVKGISTTGSTFVSYYYLFGDACGSTEQHYRIFDINIDYVDENCSSVNTTKDTLGNITQIFEFTRNDKSAGAFDDILSNFGMDQLNGVTQHRSRSADGSVRVHYDAVFEYNEYDYPVKETRTYANGDTTIYEYEYYE